MSSYEIECDDCGSHNVSKQLAQPTPPPKKRIVKMSKVLEEPKDSGFTYAVMEYSQYIYKCLNCGNQTEVFTEPS